MAQGGSVGVQQPSGGQMGLALEHHRAGRLAEAERAYQAIIDRDPSSADALNLLGVIKAQKGELADAERLIGAAMRQMPRAPMILLNYGNVMKAMERHAEAVEHFDRALALAPGYAEAWSNRGNALRGLGRETEALQSFDRALRIAPDVAEAWCSRGNVLLGLNRHEEALESYDRALMLRPRLADALAMKALILSHQGRQAEALTCLDRALAFSPKHVLSHWIRAFAALPEAAVSQQDATAASRQFSERLDELRTLDMREAHQGVGLLSLFGLTYQEQDNRALFAKHGALAGEAMQRWMDGQRIARPQRERGQRLRLGILSGYLWGHSVWHAILRGLIEHIDRAKVEIHLFHLSSEDQDSETAWARAQCASFTQRQQGLRAWIDAVLERDLDVLFYPEVCVDRLTLKLASLRLAPTQITTWGHPHTTGLPTIDCFLSADAFEPPQAQGHYSERLVRLPRLGCCFTRSEVGAAEVDLAALGIKADAPLLLSPGTAYKYAPQHDWVLPEIAQRLGRCTIVLFAHDKLRVLCDRLRARLEAAFAQRGMPFSDYCVVLPWQDKPAYYALMRRADVMLDTIGFSGFNTVMQAMECSLPVVTREGNFMRGRFGAGILRSVGLDELVAADERAYVDLAVAVASSAERRARLRQSIAERRDRLFNDTATVRAFEDCLLKLVF
jgi:predicted O-linked N-acetylglucosamine transferase (SPINDLY family)